jgi:hypothetical protein
MEKSKAIVLLNEYEEIFNNLSDKQAGILIKAIYKYQIHEVIAGLPDRELKLAFNVIKKSLDYNNQKYQEKCLKNKECGKMGGRPPKNRTVISETERLFKKPLINKENFEGGLKLSNEETERLKNNPKYKVKIQSQKEKENMCWSKLVNPCPRDRVCASPKPTPTHTAAPRGILGVGKDKASPDCSASKPQEAMPQEAKLKEQSPYDNAPSKPMTPAAQLYEAFKALYQAQTQFPYNARKEDLASMEILVARHGQHAVENKIRILHAGCKNAAFWFTQKGFSDFNVAYLVRHWNELVPFETEEERHRKKMDKLLGIKRN